MKIKFNESVTVPAGRYEKELSFKKGSIHDLSEASAYRWVRRKIAAYYVVEVAAPTLKVGRPMMAETREYKASEVVEKFSIPVKDMTTKLKKVGRPKKRV